MPKIRLLYVGSLLLLGALLVFVVFRPFVTGEEYTEIQRASLLQAEGEYIIQFDIFNREGEETRYTVNVMTGNEIYSEKVLIPSDGIFTYIHHINRDGVLGETISFAVYREGDLDPIEQTTYYLK